MTDDDAKKAVLARRARFVAAAMTGIAAASCDSCAQPCLSAVATSVDATAPPGPCLSVAYVPLDAGEQTAIDDGGAGDAGDAGEDGGRDAGKKMVGPPAPPPMPCLSRPPPPRVCLTPPRGPSSF